MTEFCQQEMRVATRGLDAKQLEQAIARCKLIHERVHLSKNQIGTINDMAWALVHATKAKLTRRQAHLVFLRFRAQIKNQYTRFAVDAPEFNLTRYMKYQTHSWNPWHMLTSVFAHKDWSHLLLNLLHFLIFATLVEIFLGRRAYVFSFLIIAYGSQLVYSIVYTIIDTKSETIGLSGVVLGMMGLAVVLLNASRTSFVPAKIFYVVWLFVIAFIAVNVYQSFPEQFDSGINVVVHAAGSIIGVLIGMVVYKRFRQRLGERERAKQVEQAEGA